MNKQTMKAQVVTKYGDPNVFNMVEMEKPEPKAGEVRIKIKAVSVGPADCALRAGKPFIVKLIFGFSRPKFPILGAEIAGIVDEIGSGVSKFKKGDEVFVHSPNIMGGYAEYLCLSESDHIVKKPANLSFEESVAMCDGGSTALVFLRDGAKLKEGQSVFIYGASGSVGLAALQVAKLMGARVTGVSSAKNHALLKSLGADEVIDYQTKDFTKDKITYDVIFDAVGKLKYKNCKKSLTQSGIYLTTSPDIGLMIASQFNKNSTKKRGRFIAAGLAQTTADLEYLFGLAQESKIKALIDKTFDFTDLAPAHSYVETGRKTGSVIVQLKDYVAHAKEGKI